MKMLKLILPLFVVALMTTGLFAQEPESVKTETSTLDYPDKPLDDVVERNLTSEKRILPYESMREGDILWSKKIWRVVDVREKMNLPFAYPEKPFFTILVDGLKDGALSAYSVEDDKFSFPISTSDVESMLFSIDTQIIIDPETYEEKMTVVRNEIDAENVKRYRLKEMWFFDAESSTMRVRILGIAPIIDKLDDDGNFQREQALFWIYYPDSREWLAKYRVANFAGNEASPITWEDLLEMRFFSSYILKQSNVRDRKIASYMTNGVDALLEGEKIKNSIFNFEQDLWSY